MAESAEMIGNVRGTMHEYYEKMREDMDRHVQSRVRGLSTRDVVAQRYTDEELRSLIASLKERSPPTEVAFRFASFIYEQQEDRIPVEVRCSAADAVADYVSIPDQQLNTLAVEVFIAWGSHRSDHRLVCKSLLRHQDSGVRRTALAFAGTFLEPQELPVLFEFRHDPSVGEIGMGGPLRYDLRDHALQVLERITNCPAAEVADCFEETPEGRASWRSWSPFLSWYEHRRG